MYTTDLQIEIDTQDWREQEYRQTYSQEQVNLCLTWAADIFIHKFLGKDNLAEAYIA